LRVIGGSCKGRILKAPKGLKTRPTQDRVREALFSIIMPEIPGSHFLDIFAGSGAVGIVALSRGAAELTLIENQKEALKVIRENLDKTGFFANIFPCDVYQALKQLRQNEYLFEIVFMDPPYAKGFTEPVVENLESIHILKPGGLLIIETSKEEAEPGNIIRFQLQKQKVYGDTKLSFFRFQK